MEAQELMLLRSWLEPDGSADSYVRIDADNYGSTDEHTYTHLDLKIADCQRHIRLGFFVDSQKPQTKAKALAKLAILEDALALLHATIEAASGE